MKFFTSKLFYFSFLIFTISISSNPIILNENSKVYNLKPDNIFIFEDKENSYSFDSLNSSLFQKSTTATPNFGFTDSAIWVKLEFTNETNQFLNFVLEFSEPQVDYFQVYIPDENGVIQTYKGGDFEKFSIRQIKYHNFLFPFKIVGNSSKQIYLHFEPGYIIIPLKVYSDIGIVENTSKTRTIQGGFYGIMIVMIIYNLFLFLPSKIVVTYSIVYTFHLTLEFSQT